MCSKLLKAAQDKLAALEKNVLGYPNVIIWSELEQCPKKSSLLLKKLIEVHRKDPNELRKLYQRFIAPQQIALEQFENLQFTVDLTVLYSKNYNSMNTLIGKFESDLINKVHSYLS
jgi:hypothetical protein